MALIGISGKIGSGKDLTGKIINWLIWKERYYKDDNSVKFMESWYPKASDGGMFEVKKFAYKLKQIVSLITGCSIEDLESQEFKAKQLGEEWNWYKTYQTTSEGTAFIRSTPTEEAKKFLPFPERIKPYTYREMLQRVGTEAMRNCIHEDIWVNALFADYKTDKNRKVSPSLEYYTSNWIITDMRFPNELKAVEDRDGITIRINRKTQKDRYCKHCEKGYNYNQCEADIHICPDCGNVSTFSAIEVPSTHPSETALDNSKFKYEIDNNGTIEELIEKVKEILILEKII